MEGVLDDEALAGPHAARVTVGPLRVAQPVLRTDWNSFVDLLAFECQIWGGANTPVVPVDSNGAITLAYRTELSGGDFHGLEGLTHGDLGTIDLDEDAAISFNERRATWGRQFAPALLRYRKQRKYAPLTVTILEEDDPWQGVYLACLGTLPDSPDSKLLEDGGLRPELRFDDFVRLHRPRVTGSLSDLLDRFHPEHPELTPRRLSMYRLPYGSDTPMPFFNEPQGVLPRMTAQRELAGPRVVVLCSPHSVEDHALLWNLRAAYGDEGPLPIGIPSGADVKNDLAALIGHPQLQRYGRTLPLLVTSASLSREQVAECVQGIAGFTAVGDTSEVVTFGPSAGWTEEISLAWHEGAARINPIRPEDHPKILQHPAFNRYVRLGVGVDVLDQPAPRGPGMRFDAVNWQVYGGAAHRWNSGTRVGGVDLFWPSKLVFAKAIAARRHIELRESEPGRAARVVLEGMASIYDLTLLAHAPLLQLLEEKAATEGITHYQKKLRELDREVDLSAEVAASAESLPQIHFGELKKVFGGSTDATKYWIGWAERAGLLIRGFSLQCESCGAKQWLPMEAFAPPIICRGCAKVMVAPFGTRESVQFTFKLSERLRRLYQHNGIGSLLALRYFHHVLASSLIGLHPGIECRVKGEVVGEADLLILTREGQLIPVELKSSYAGVTGDQVRKLTKLSDLLAAPWAALAVLQSGSEAPSDYVSLEVRAGVSGFHRLTLAADALLSPMPVWSLGSDPFAWQTLSHDEWQERQRDFVDGLARRYRDEAPGWLEFSMTRRKGSGVV